MFLAVIDQETVTIAAASAVVITAIGATWKVSRLVGSLKGAIVGLNHSFELFKKDIEIRAAKSGRTISRREFRAWIMVTKANNPSWKVDLLDDEDSEEDTSP